MTSRQAELSDKIKSLDERKFLDSPKSHVTVMDTMRGGGCSKLVSGSNLAVRNILGGSKCTSTTWFEISVGKFVVKFRANHTVYAQISVFIKASN